MRTPYWRCPTHHHGWSSHFRLFDTWPRTASRWSLYRDFVDISLISEVQGPNSLHYTFSPCSSGLPVAWDIQPNDQLCSKRRPRRREEETMARLQKRDLPWRDRSLGLKEKTLRGGVLLAGIARLFLGELKKAHAAQTERAEKTTSAIGIIPTWEREYSSFRICFGLDSGASSSWWAGGSARLLEG